MLSTMDLHKLRVLQDKDVICPATDRSTSVVVEHIPWGTPKISRCETFGRGRVQCDQACLKSSPPG